MTIAITSAAIISTARGQQQFKELSVERRRAAPLRSIINYNYHPFLEAYMSGDKTSPFIETMSRRNHHVRPPLKLRTHADDPLPTHTHWPLQLSARCQITHRTQSSSPSRCSVTSTFQGAPGSRNFLPWGYFSKRPPGRGGQTLVALAGAFRTVLPVTTASTWSPLWSSPALWAACRRRWAAAEPSKCWWSETPGWARPASHTASAPGSSPAEWRPPSAWTSARGFWMSTERKSR